MSGPFVPARDAQPIDLLQQSLAGNGWEGLEEMLRRPPGSAPLQPGDDVARFMAGLYRTPEGRKLFEWIMDITLRLPLRSTGRTFEETALMTATRQGINGVGEVVLAAIAHGDKLISNQNGAGT
jgi:hypothetical protein